MFDSACAGQQYPCVSIYHLWPKNKFQLVPLAKRQHTANIIPVVHHYISSAAAASLGDIELFFIQRIQLPVQRSQPFIQRI